MLQLDPTQLIHRHPAFLPRRDQIYRRKSYRPLPALDGWLVFWDGG